MLRRRPRWPPLATVVLLAACMPGEPSTSDKAGTSDATQSLPRSLPAGAVAGEVAGRSFRLGEATWQPTTGVLTFQQGEDTNSATYISVSLFTFPDEEIPEDVRIDVGPGTSAGTVPHVHLFWKPAGSAAGDLSNDVVTNGYELELRLARFQEGALSGRVRLRHAGDPALDLEGSFQARVEGAWRYGHRPDVTRTSDDVFAFLAFEYLSERREGVRQESFEVNRTRWRAPHDDGPGWAVVHTSWGPEGNRREARALLENPGEGWRVARELEPDEVAAAHLPVDGAPESQWMESLAGTLLERRHQASHLDTKIEVPRSTEGGWSPESGLGWRTIFWRRGDDPTLYFDRLLFQKEDGEWQLVRSLEPDETVDHRRGRVLRGQSPPYHPDLPFQLQMADEDVELVREVLAPAG